MHERIRNKREDFCHKTSKSLVDKYDFIAHEDLNVKEMLEQKKLSKSISDAAWGTLVLFLTYKAENAGGKVITVNPKNTSKMCSKCGALVDKDLSERVHNCPSCGLKMDRDLNASINILRLGQKSLAAAKAAA